MSKKPIEIPLQREAFVRKAEVARHFGVHPRTIERWVQFGMPVRKVGSAQGVVRFRLSECEHWLETQSVGREEEA